MLTRWLAIPLLLIAGYFIYDTYQTGQNNLVFIIPAFVILAALYTLGPQINFWWSQRNPPKLERPALDFLTKYHQFYASLGEVEAEKFRRRVALIRMAKDFKSQSADSMPEDIRIVFSANLAHLTFGLDRFLLPDYETVVVYPRPFPSPAYPETFHASETFDEDGVLLFAAQQMLNGFIQPDQFYNLGLHELAVALTKSHPDWAWPEPDATTWERLADLSGFSREHLIQWIGRPDVELLAVLIVHYLQFPERFRNALPRYHQQLTLVLYPGNRTAP